MIRLMPMLVLCIAGGMLAACGAGEPAAIADTPTPALPTVTVNVPTVTIDVPASSPQPTASPSAAPTVALIPPSPAASASTATPEPSLDEEPYATLGSPDAPVVIYEFSDFGCPSCRQFALFTFPTLKEEYIDTGKVLFIFKDYPIVSQHGSLAAQAAECAGAQGAYWEMHDQLFLDPAEWDASPEAALQAFRRYAETHSLDADALLSCVTQEQYRADIDRDFDEGLEIGIFGTPTFIINRRLLSGAQPIEVFRDIIDRALTE